MRRVYGWVGRITITGVGLALLLTAFAGWAQAGGPLPAPEIEAGSMSSALALLIGAGFVIKGRFRNH